MIGNAVCCLAPGAKDATGDGGGNSSLGLPGLQATVKPAGNGTAVQKIEQALQAAIHGSNSVDFTNALGGGVGKTARVIPFPVVDPLSPIRKAGRAPVAGYTAFPAPESTVQPNRNRRRMRVREISQPGRRLSYFNVRGTENVGAPAKGSSQSGFVDLAAESDAGVGLSGLGDLGLIWNGGIDEGSIYNSSSPTKLQTVLGTIQATLPATIAAFRANPSNIYPGSYNTSPYTQGIAPTTGGAAEGVGAGVGQAADTLGNTFSRFVTEHPYLVIGGGAALVLLFMNPPRRR